jgi:glycosyltransferase involved in cell wall biosynthesis
MHVIVVSDYGEVTGGASQVAILEARALAEQGAEVTFFCATEPLSDRLRHRRIRVECLGIPDVWQRGHVAAAVQGIWNRGAARAFRHLLRRADPACTVIHFHQWAKALSPSVLRVAARTGFRALITLHDYLSFCPVGTYFDFGRNRPCQRRPLSPSCVVAACDPRSYAHKVVRLARQFDFPELLRRVEDRWAFVHVSPLAAALAKSHLPCGARHVIVTHPVDIRRTQQADVGASVAFLFVGRFLREKGCVDLAEVAASLGFDVAFLGQGPELATLSAKHQRAQFLPWGPREAVIEALNRCRALVLPSICFETFGMVVPEALARGVPVIVSDRVGAGAMIVHGVNGFIYRAGDREDLGRCLNAMADTGRAHAMAAEAYRRYWAAPLSLRAHAEAIMNVCRAMLAEPGKCAVVADPG